MRGAVPRTPPAEGRAAPVRSSPRSIWLLAAVGDHALLPKVARVGADPPDGVGADQEAGSAAAAGPRGHPPDGDRLSVADPRATDYLSLSLPRRARKRRIRVWAYRRSTKIYEPAAEKHSVLTLSRVEGRGGGCGRLMEGERQLAAQRIDLLPVSAAGAGESCIHREARADRIAKLSRHVHDEEGDFVELYRKQSLSEGLSGQFQTDVRGRRRARRCIRRARRGTGVCGTGRRGIHWGGNAGGGVGERAERLRRRERLRARVLVPDEGVGPMPPTQVVSFNDGWTCRAFPCPSMRADDSTAGRGRSGGCRSWCSERGPAAFDVRR